MTCWAVIVLTVIMHDASLQIRSQYEYIGKYNIQSVAHQAANQWNESPQKVYGLDSDERLLYQSAHVISCRDTKKLGRLQ